MTAGRTVVGLSTHWGTPQKYVEAVRLAFGGTISLDPCSNIWSIVNAQTEWALPEHDGLKNKWDFPTIYVNPPYGLDKERQTRISHWLAKCAAAAEEFGSEVIALIPIAANTKHWKDHIWAKATSICFLYDTRLRFLENGRNSGKGAPMACCAVYWGKHPQRFADAFAEHGATLELSGISLPDNVKQAKLKLVMS
jgi:hypothetical protein